MTKPSTKDRILDSALTLFAERGYDGVGVDLIAETAGLKGPSLYKHFKGKEAVLDALMDRTEAYYAAHFGSAEQPGALPPSMVALVQSSMQRIRFTISDPTVIRVRRIFAMEQFRNPRIAALATKHSIDIIVAMYSGIFRGMMQAGTMRQDDPELLAASFTAPITLLIQMSDREPQRTPEALERIEALLTHFAREYSAGSSDDR